MRDLNNFHSAFQKHQDKETQDAFLLKYCCATIPKRKRPTNKKHTPKNFHTKFTVHSILQKKIIPVC